MSLCLQSFLRLSAASPNPNYLQFLLVARKEVVLEAIVQFPLCLEARSFKVVENNLPLVQCAAQEIPANVLRCHLPHNFTVDSRVAQVPKDVTALIMAQRLDPL